MKAASASGNALFAPFAALFAVMNEHNQVISYKFTRSKGHDEVIPILEGLRRRYDLQVRLWLSLPELCCAVLTNMHLCDDRCAELAASRGHIQRQLLRGPRRHHASFPKRAGPGDCDVSSISCSARACLCR